MLFSSKSIEHDPVVDHEESGERRLGLAVRNEASQDDSADRRRGVQ